MSTKTKEKRPRGRPTKYKPEYCQELIEHFNVDLFRTRIKEVASHGKAIALAEEVAAIMPSFLAFSK